MFATWLIEQGVNLEAIRELMGHKNRNTTDRYAYLNRKKASKFLSVIPNLERIDTKQGNDRLPFVSKKAVSN